MRSKLAVVGATLFLLTGAGCKQEVPPTKAAPDPVTSTPVQPQRPAAPPEAGTPGPVERTARAAGEVIDDATITAKIKAALIDSTEVKALDVKVQTQKGVVQLSGFVTAQREIDKAVEIAKSVRGVQEVQNKMSLRPQ